MKKLEKGFTLIELMIVVAIIAILAAVAAPKFADQIKKAKDSKALAITGAYRSASNIYYADNDGVWADSFGDMADEVDTGTLGSTFTDVNLSTNLTNAVSPAAVTLAVGTSTTSGTEGPYITLDYDNTNGEIVINAAAVDDTKGNSWTKY